MPTKPLPITVKDTIDVLMFGKKEQIVIFENNKSIVYDIPRRFSF